MTLAGFGTVPGSGSLPRGEPVRSGADPGVLAGAAVVVIEEAYADALDLPRRRSALAPPAEISQKSTTTPGTKQPSRKAQALVFNWRSKPTV